MTLYQTMAEAITARQKDDEEKFSEFIDRSISVVESLDKPKADNTLALEYMQSEVERFEQAEVGEKSIDAFLSDSDGYQEQMKWVSLDFSSSAVDQRLIDLKENQDKRNEITKIYMDKHAAGSED